MYIDHFVVVNFVIDWSLLMLFLLTNRVYCNLIRALMREDITTRKKIKIICYIVIPLFPFAMIYLSYILSRRFFDATDNIIHMRHQRINEHMLTSDVRGYKKMPHPDTFKDR